MKISNKIIKKYESEILFDYVYLDIMYNGYRSVIGFKTKQLILYSVYRTLSRKDSAEMLGIPQDASKKEVKQAYLQMAKQFHPDNKVNDYLIIHMICNKDEIILI